MTRFFINRKSGTSNSKVLNMAKQTLIEDKNTRNEEQVEEPDLDEGQDEVSRDQTELQIP